MISQSAKTTQAAFWAVVSPDEEGEGEGDEDTSSESGKMVSREHVLKYDVKV